MGGKNGIVLGAGTTLSQKSVVKLLETIPK